MTCFQLCPSTDLPHILCTSIVTSVHQRQINTVNYGTRLLLCCKWWLLRATSSDNKHFKFSMSQVGLYCWFQDHSKTQLYNILSNVSVSP